MKHTISDVLLLIGIALNLLLPGLAILVIIFEIVLLSTLLFISVPLSWFVIPVVILIITYTVNILVFAVGLRGSLK